jgi:hypothetical protein
MYMHQKRLTWGDLILMVLRKSNERDRKLLWIVLHSTVCEMVEREAQTGSRATTALVCYDATPSV